MAGESLQKTISDSSEQLRNQGLQTLLILSAGALAVWFHEALRWPLNLPGRHGLELMAILLFVRLGTSRYYAASLAAIGGVGAGFLFDGSLGLGAMILLLQSLFIDTSYHLLKHHRLTMMLMIVVTGLAHTLKPLIKLLAMSELGLISDSLDQGLAYPLMTHFSFGFLGGLAAVLAWLSIKKMKSNQ